MTYGFLDTYTPSPEGFRTAYTDGSSSGTAQGCIGWAWWVSDDEWEAGSQEQGTNNVAEITGILRAVEATPADVPLLVVSDSQYAIGAIFTWFSGWERGGWRTKSGDEVKNVPLIRQARAAVLEHRAPLLVKHVRGHGKDSSALAEDVHGNGLADMLATEVRQRAKENGEVEEVGPFDRFIVHGEGRRKRPFTKTA